MEIILEKVEEGREEELDLGEVMCPICLSILVEPVAMPCKHIMCLPCFNGTVSNASLKCPWCRFGEEVRKRELGLEEVGDTEELFPCLPNHQLAAKGEVALEYQAAKERVEMERQREKEEEDRKSQEEMTRLIEEEEKKELERRREREEEERQSEEMLAKEKEEERQDAYVRFSKKEAPWIKATPERRSEQALKDITNSAKRKGNTPPNKHLFQKGNTPSVLKMFERTPKMKRPSQGHAHLQLNKNKVKDEKDSEIYCEDFIKRQRITENRLEGEKKDVKIAKKLEQAPEPGNIPSQDGTGSFPQSRFKAFHLNEVSTDARLTVGSTTEKSSHGSETAVGLSARRKTDLLQLILKLQQASRENLNDPNILKEINSTANAIAILSSPSAGSENLDWRPDKENVPVHSRVEKTPEKSERGRRQDSPPFGLATPCETSPPAPGPSSSTYNTVKERRQDPSPFELATPSEAPPPTPGPSSSTFNSERKRRQDFSPFRLATPCRTPSPGPSSSTSNSKRERRQDSSPFGLATPSGASPPTLGPSSSTFISQSSVVCPTSSVGESAVTKSSTQQNTRKNASTADKEFTEDELMEVCQVNSKGTQKNSRSKMPPGPNVLPCPKQESPTISRTSSSSFKTVEEVCPVTIGVPSQNWCPVTIGVQKNKENLPNLMSPVLSEGELMVTTKGGFEKAQAENNEEKKSSACEMILLAAQMRAKVKWSCNTCGKFLQNEAEAKRHSILGEVKFSGDRNRMKFPGKNKCVVVKERVFTEEEIHSKTGFGLVSGLADPSEAKMQGYGSEGGSGQIAEHSVTHKSTNSPEQTQNKVSTQEASLAQENIPSIKTEEVPLSLHKDDEEMEHCVKQERETKDVNMDLTSSRELVSTEIDSSLVAEQLKREEAEDNEEEKPSNCEMILLAARMRAKVKWSCNTCGKFLQNEAEAKRHIHVEFRGDRNQMTLSGKKKCVVVKERVFTEEEIHSKTGFGLVSGLTDPSETKVEGCGSEGGSGQISQHSVTHKSQTSPQQTKSVVSFQEVSLVKQNIPQTGPQQTQNILSSQEASLAQEDIPTTETEEVSLGSHKDDEEMEPCIKEEDSNMDLKSWHAQVSPGVKFGFCSSYLSSSEVEQRKPMSETMGDSSEEVLVENIVVHALSEPDEQQRKRSTSPVPGYSKDVTAGLDLEKLLEFEAEERRKQEEEDALLAKRLQEESDLETRPFFFLDRQENTLTGPKATLPKQSSVPSLSGRPRSCGGRHRTLGCKKCKGCLANNCGRCANCRDMTRFGGRGTGKQRCIWRRCVAPIPGSCPTCSRASL